jgi:hypothetical protein
LDKKADTEKMRGDEWSQRYSLEVELAKIYRQKEIYWQRGCKMDSGGGF